MASVTLTGLPGTGGKAIAAAKFNHAEGAGRLLRWTRAVHSSGPLGSITVWLDDGGQFRCERQYFTRMQAWGTFDSIDQVVAWLRSNLPLIGREAA